jgi:hypothetical protein
LWPLILDAGHREEIAEEEMEEHWTRLDSNRAASPATASCF